VCIVPFAILVYLENGKFGRTAYLHEIFLLTGEKCYRKSWNVKSSFWRAGNGKNMKFWSCFRSSWVACHLLRVMKSQPSVKKTDEHVD